MKERYDFFDLSIDNHVASVAFDRPEKSNALHMEAWKELKAVFDDLSFRPEVRTIVLSGHGKHFCAGIDLALLMDVGRVDGISCESRKREEIRSFILMLQDCISAIEKCRKPVIAAIHGACIGGGLDIVTACDMRFCAGDAYFCIKEVDMGLVADIGTLQRLPHILQPGIVAELTFTGRNVTADEAKKIGLVNNFFDGKDEMMASVFQLAATIASKSPLVIRGTKEILRYSREHRTDDALEYMATYNAAFLLSEDLEEAFKSQMTREAPKFKN